MTTEERLAILERGLARTRRLLATIAAAGLVVLLVAGAALPFTDLAVKTLWVKAPSGETVSELTDNGNAKVGKDLTVGGALKVGKVDVADLSTRIDRMERRLAAGLLGRGLKPLALDQLDGTRHEFMADTDGFVVVVTGGLASVENAEILVNGQRLARYVRLAPPVYDSLICPVPAGAKCQINVSANRGVDNVRLRGPGDASVHWLPLAIPKK